MGHEQETHTELWRLTLTEDEKELRFVYLEWPEAERQKGRGLYRGLCPVPKQGRRLFWAGPRSPLFLFVGVRIALQDGVHGTEVDVPGGLYEGGLFGVVDDVGVGRVAGGSEAAAFFVGCFPFAFCLHLAHV